jgi:hypothetical protein
VAENLSNGYGLEHVVVVGQLLSTRECDLESFTAAFNGVGWHPWNEIRAPMTGLESEMGFWRGPALSPVWVLFSSGMRSVFSIKIGFKLTIPESRHDGYVEILS